ncbi:hypothetical protein CANCADRAFT_32347 [Tortispora caseinolytica NRRL Y-17796]|uniref:Golgi apparatus membrane protein TVP18 n=1 Tax=Tortispora caseinolytica NRRL Y-17796 TaxID=767744 RepID=A0A1E4TAY9_9ASCO|nr:hypothetical protein CANCADRAFT_32347 [Tortispora caseinolytica NRRL Y-17796]
MTVLEELKSKNFSIYGQWTGLLCVIICWALGIANIFHFGLVIIFAIICIVEGFVIFFVEIPFFLKICPLSERFVNFLQHFASNWPRAGFYAIMAASMYLSLIIEVTSLLVPAVFLTINAIFYALAAFSSQEFKGSEVLGSKNLARTAAQQLF